MKFTGLQNLVKALKAITSCSPRRLAFGSSSSTLVLRACVICYNRVLACTCHDYQNKEKYEWNDWNDWNIQSWPWPKIIVCGNDLRAASDHDALLMSTLHHVLLGSQAGFGAGAESNWRQTWQGTSSYTRKVVERLASPENYGFTSQGLT